MSKAKQGKKMTEAEFVKRYNGSGVDLEGLLRIAKDVDGKVGQLASAILPILREFDAELERLDFEVG